MLIVYQFTQQVTVCPLQLQDSALKKFRLVEDPDLGRNGKTLGYQSMIAWVQLHKQEHNSNVSLVSPRGVELVTDTFV